MGGRGGSAIMGGCCCTTITGLTGWSDAASWGLAGWGIAEAVVGGCGGAGTEGSEDFGTGGAFPTETGGNGGADLGIAGPIFSFSSSGLQRTNSIA